MTTAKKPAAKADEQISISRIGTERMSVPIVGTSPLIVSKFSEKAKRAMLDNQQGRAAAGKAPKDPEADYQAAFYRTKEGYGFPAVGFKACAISAARLYPKLTMTSLRQFLFFKGIFSENDSQALVEIVGEPRMREDIVRISMGKTDLRYRPEFPEWSAVLEIVFVKSSVNRESVLNLIDAGGMTVGVGEWRPERSGDSGTFMIDPTRDLVIVS